MLYRKKKKSGQIKHINPADIPKDPTPLPPGFEWRDFDVTNDDEVREVCDFLEQHYVEDANGYFKVIYTIEKFRWAVQTPGYKKEYHFTIRNSKNGKIMGMVMGDPKKFVINGEVVKLVEGNFMCVHAKLRNKRLAQILLQEQLRRNRINNQIHAMYTSGHTMPTPFVTTHYMNRFINPSKLCEIRYTNMPFNMSLKEFDKRHALPKKDRIHIQGTVR